jgi:uncharacterized protein YcbK (DUF882 family)
MTIPVAVRWVLAILVLTQMASVRMVHSQRLDLVNMKRFFHSGDGRIHMTSEKNGRSFNGPYRMGDGHYDDDAYEAISAVFGAPYKSGRRGLSLRLIEFLDYLEDRLAPGALLTITSGYRAPTYNTKLRKGGALAAKASLHQYGMAADFFLEGVPSLRVWEYVRAMGFGGTGYYHGKTVHVDVGPARSWDETSSGVGTGLSDDNKLIGLVTDFDVYSPGETVTLSFIRMTAFPIAVHPEFNLLPAAEATNAQGVIRFRPDFETSSAGACVEFSDISQMGFIRWSLPSNLPVGHYQISVRFCKNRWERMPKEISTSRFEIRRP